MKRLIGILSFLFCFSAFADTSVAPARVSLFSTTVDWRGVTGLPLSQYTGYFTGRDRSLLKNGLILYYLDYNMRE